MTNHVETLKNVLGSQIVTNVMSDQALLTQLLQKGFKGYENMNLEEVTNMFVDMFGWAKYAEAVNTISAPPVQTSTSSVTNIKKYIAYSDASHSPETGKGYIAYAIKTTDDELVVRDGFEVEMANIYLGESMALVKMLEKALELGIKDIEVYGDNKGLIDSINNKKSKNQGHVLKAYNVMTKFDNISLTWTKRDGNKYADMLCRLVKRGVRIAKRGGQFDLNELLQISKTEGEKLA
jgi:ribonuclease HI